MFAMQYFMIEFEIMKILFTKILCCENLELYTVVHAVTDSRSAGDIQSCRN